MPTLTSVCRFQCCWCCWCCCPRGCVQTANIANIATTAITTISQDLGDLSWPRVSVQPLFTPASLHPTSDNQRLETPMKTPALTGEQEDRGLESRWQR